MNYTALMLAALLMIANVASAGELKRITDANGDSVAIVVPADARLGHTRQVLHTDPAELLRSMKYAPADVIKVNVVAPTQQAAQSAREAIRQHFPRDARPAVSIVVGSLGRSQPTFGMDFIVVSEASAAPATPTVYISGQAENAPTAAEAAARTIASLKQTLTFVGCRDEAILQAKCFLTPMSAISEVTAEFEEAFGGHNVPLVFVEWKSDLPIEIELIAKAPPPPADAPQLEYLTPPGKTASPLFARIVRVNRGDIIYVGDLFAETSGSGEQQVMSIFQQLQDVLKQTGSDLRHLVKATYYVSDDDASKQLNAIRPKFYDPQRPPAASKAIVPAVGMSDRSISIDMIAVPSTQTSR